MFSRSKESKKEDDEKLPNKGDRKWLPADTKTWTPAEPRKGHPWTTAAASTKGSKADTKAVALLPGRKVSSGPAVPERASPPASIRSVGRSAGPSSLRSQPSAMSVITYHSEITKDPIGGPRHWFKLPNPKAYKDLVKNIDAVYEQPHVLMLGAGQGGTFGYGTKYTHERDWEVSGPSLVVNSSNTKHLTFFGRGIEFIGTKDCVSCTGVYFELTKGRVFCAHINTWHSDVAYDEPDLLPGTREYIDIRKAVYERLTLHSHEFNWTYNDVQLATLTVTCPEPERQAYVVPDALKDFLHLNARPEVLNGHGFIMKPGDRTDMA